MLYNFERRKFGLAAITDSTGNNNEAGAKGGAVSA
jgi:hypothetical protein